MSSDSNKDDIAIRVSNVTKAYKIFDSPGKRFLYHVFHAKLGKDFIALNNISFEVKKGEAFGIIGRNGSGKSTMLQILAGIIKASSGQIKINGRVAALLELGSGFNPDSTGYENIYMNAAILGLSKDDIEKKVQQIIDFADIGDFVNQPVKTYSSGMYIRLAFSVAINVDADILLIDEALAVGDVFFRQKCYSKLNELKKEGKTIILVSHGMNEVEQFCDRALLLSKSEQIMCGESREVVQHYYVIDQNDTGTMVSSEEQTEGKRDVQNVNSLAPSEKTGWKDFNCTIDYTKQINSGKVEFLNIGIFDADGKPKKVFCQGEKAYFLYEVRILESIKVPLCGIVFYDQKNTIIFGKDALQSEISLPEEVEAGKTAVCIFEIKLDIAVGEYTFDSGFNTIGADDFRERSYRNQEEVDETIERLCCIPNAGNFVVNAKKVGEPMQIMFHGCCDLPNKVELTLE